jgi:hypothetical protein
MISDKEEAAPIAMRALLQYIRNRKLDVLTPHIGVGAQMSAVGFINGNLDAREGPVAEVLAEVLPKSSSGGMSDVDEGSTPQHWRIECHLTRGGEGDPIDLVATCTLDGSGKISNIECEIEPSM